jgi:hypothetical protein
MMADTMEPARRRGARAFDAQMAAELRAMISEFETSSLDASEGDGSPHD